MLAYCIQDINRLIFIQGINDINVGLTYVIAPQFGVMERQISINRQMDLMEK